jgi:hypothetical protein
MTLGFLPARPLPFQIAGLSFAWSFAASIFSFIAVKRRTRRSNRKARAGPPGRIAFCVQMGHGPCAFRESDVRRAVKAILEAGQQIAGVRFFKDGGFVVVVGKPGDGELLKHNVWDEVLPNEPN